MSAATIRNIAEEMSPGIRRSAAAGPVPPSSVTRKPSTCKGTPAAASIRSVWSRLGRGSTTEVAPVARSPANNSAVLTCALATWSS
jgi:hypothetical protein